jgi:hypothetical protein
MQHSSSIGVYITATALSTLHEQVHAADSTVLAILLSVKLLSASSVYLKLLEALLQLTPQVWYSSSIQLSEPCLISWC